MSHDAAPGVIGPEALWARHGSSLYSMALVLLGDRKTALAALAAGVVDLYAHSAGPDRQPLGLHPHRAAGYSVFQRCDQQLASGTDLATGHGPGVVRQLGMLAVLQRRSLALCVFGGHTYREAAEVLGVSPQLVAQLLISGLRDVASAARDRGVLSLEP